MFSLTITKILRRVFNTNTDHCTSTYWWYKSTVGKDNQQYK